MKWNDSKQSKARAVCLAAPVALLFLFRLPLAVLRDFDPDELQHLHGGYSVAAGLVPYVDYYEHHPPWIAWLLAGVVAALGESWSTVLAARGLVLAVTGGLLWCAYSVFRRAGGSKVALVALALLSTTVLFVDKSLEIRPDVPAVLCFLLGLRAALEAIRSEGTRHDALAGLAFGCALMFTPKLAFGVAGAVAGMLLAARRRARVRGAAAMAAAALVPLVATLLALGSRGALAAFFEHVVVAPLGWPRELSASRFTLELLRQNPFVAIAGALGTAYLLRPASLRSERGPERAVLGAAALAIAAGWVVVPVPWPQFLLPLLPLLAFGAASVAVDAAERLEGAIGASARASRSRHLVAAAAVAAALALAALGVREHDPNRLAAAALLASGLAACACAPERDRILAAAVLLATALPLCRVVARAEWRNTELRREFDFVMAETAPTDAVLTSWRGCAVFRPHAYHFFFLHPGMLRVMTDEQKGPELLAALRRTRPRAVIRGDGVRALSADVNAYLDAHYAASGVGDIWLRRAP